MARINYSANTAEARQLAPERVPQSPPIKRAAPKPQLHPKASPASIKLANKRRVAAVLVAIALVLAWIVPTLVADASSEVRAAQIVKAEKILNDAKRESVRLKSDVESSLRMEMYRQFGLDDPFEAAIGELGMIRADGDSAVILPPQD